MTYDENEGYWIQTMQINDSDKAVDDSITLGAGEKSCLPSIWRKMGSITAN